MNGRFMATVNNAMTKAALRVAAVVEVKAKEKMEAKRVHPLMGISPLISSFSYSVMSLNTNKVKAIVFAGGPDSKAVYTDWVDKGHNLVNGQFWTGHHFMDAGEKAGQKISASVLDEEINKIL